MDDVKTMQRTFCTKCGAPLADGVCSVGCPARERSDATSTTHLPTGDEAGSSEPAGASLAEPTRRAGAADSPIQPPVYASAGLLVEQGPEPSTANAPTRGSGANRPPRRIGARVLGASAAGALLAATAFAGVTSQHQLSGRIDDLEAALDGSVHAQSAAQKQVNDLSDQMDHQVQQLATTRNQLNNRPAAGKVAKVAASSVFTVYAGDALGSAFVVTSGDESQLITNYHVVKDEYRAGNRGVGVRRNGSSYQGQIVDVSEADDLAVIRVNQQLPALDLVTERAQIGDPVLVLGSPNGLGGTLTSGIVSSYRKLEATDYLQFSAPISPGNSGGPVLDETGQVLGVAVMKDVSDFTEGISYAIPTGRVCRAVLVC